MKILTAETVAIALFFISFYGVISSKNIIKTIISIGLMDTAVVVFFLALGFSEGNAPPIGKQLVNVSDPLPQALVITAIIMGAALTAVDLVMLISLYRKHKTADWDVIQERKRR